MREVTLHHGKFRLTLQLLRQQFSIQTIWFCLLSGFITLSRVRTLKVPFFTTFCFVAQYIKNCFNCMACNCFLKLLVTTYSSSCISYTYEDTQIESLHTLKIMLKNSLAFEWQGNMYEFRSLFFFIWIVCHLPKLSLSMVLWQHQKGTLHEK